MSEPQSTPTNVNPQPKARYLASAAIVQIHRKMMSDGSFQHALDTALLQYQGELAGQAVDGSGAAANHFKVVGALQFVNVLKNLSETPVIPKTVPVGNLQHQA